MFIVCGLEFNLFDKIVGRKSVGTVRMIFSIPEDVLIRTETLVVGIWDEENSQCSFTPFLFQEDTQSQQRYLLIHVLSMEREKKDE
jgi:hypothetical protein